MMVKRMLLALALALPFSAFAYHCPVDMKKIDEALAAGPGLGEEELAEVKRLRAEGEELHNAGDHGAAVDVLGQALEMLGVE